MRIGVLSSGIGELDWLQRLGFRAMEWVRFAESPAMQDDWKPFCERVASEFRAHDIRISAIGAYYQNPLDPKQTDSARTILRRAIEVAGHIGVKTVSGFAGAVVELETNPRGGNPVYKPLTNYLPQLLAFWEPLGKFATDHGVRLAFENCPQGIWRQPVMHYNTMSQPAAWELFFNETKCDNLGLEWDPSHLICQFIDPVANVRQFASKIFHVHAKDAFLNRPLLERYGICHPGVAEHRFPGLGQANWPEIVRELIRASYDSDVNIEGWHDPVFRNHPNGPQLEDTGLLIGKKTLEPLVAGTE